MRTDPSGQYEIKVPYGVYWMEVLKDVACSVRRPDFNVSASDGLSFDFVLVPCARDSSVSDYHEEEIPANKSIGLPELRRAYIGWNHRRLQVVYSSSLPTAFPGNTDDG